MTLSTCNNCGNAFYWDWEEAFDKFGFGDGDGQVMTETVADALRSAGYTVVAEPWGIHNLVITSIKRDDQEQIPQKVTLGYDDPRDYLPDAVIKLLDEKLGGESEVQS